jgi:hypothetical protein
MADFLTAPNLSALDGISHAFFTRRGGVSRGIYESLNCGIGSDDDPEAVKENRARASAAIGAAPDRFLTPYQIHSAEAFVVDEPFAPGPDGPQADALVTNRPGIAIAVSTADCVPVLLADPQAGVIAAVHAGWRGALGGVLESALEAMRGLGAETGRVQAAIGPAICTSAYEVGEEFRDSFLKEDPASERFFSPGKSGRPHFDLPSYVGARLEKAGTSDVSTIRLCTYSEAERLFSFRRTTHLGETDYGRQVSAIMLKE